MEEQLSEAEKRQILEAAGKKTSKLRIISIVLAVLSIGIQVFALLLAMIPFLGVFICLIVQLLTLVLGLLALGVMIYTRVHIDNLRRKLWPSGNAAILAPEVDYGRIGAIAPYIVGVCAGSGVAFALLALSNFALLLIAQH